MRFATAALSYGVAAAAGDTAAKLAKVPPPPLRWRRVRGPWFDNNLATLEHTEEGLEMWWARGKVEDGRHDRPVLDRVATVVVGRDGTARDRDGRSRLRKRA
jgi:hypothetical protein